MIGYICERYRVECLGMTRKQFSNETGLSVSQIRHFEQGRSRNMKILLQYIRLGLDIEDVQGMDEIDRDLDEIERRNATHD